VPGALRAGGIVIVERRADLDAVLTVLYRYSK